MQPWELIVYTACIELKTNRAHNEVVNRHRRYTNRQRRLDRLMSKIRDSCAPLVKVTTLHREPNPSQRGGMPFTLEPRVVEIAAPFPSTIDALKWPLLKGMVEKDTSVEEMEQTFNQRRDEIDRAISEWNAKVEQDVFDIWDEGRAEEASAGRVEGSTRKPGASN